MPLIALKDWLKLWKS